MAGRAAPAVLIMLLGMLLGACGGAPPASPASSASGRSTPADSSTAPLQATPLPTPIPPTLAPLPTPTPASPAEPTRTPATPRPLARSLECGDFPSQAAAQDLLRSNPLDPYNLDPDRNGIACETNPAPFDRIPVPRR